MKKLTTNEPETHSADIVSENIAQLKLLFPEAFTEDRVDFDVLKQLLGGVIDERDEKYGLSWHGKRQARRLALTPSAGTLRPCLDESVDWASTRNLMIEGDNLEVLKLLQKSYSGRIKLIYIDPPYNTGKDFVYPDSFQDSIKNYEMLTGQRDGDRRVSTNPEASGRFHTNWLSMMAPRLRLARSLLRDDGLIFISIDDNEVHHLRVVCDEIFGTENFLGCVIWQKKYAPANDTVDLSPSHDYILVYVKLRPSDGGSQVAVLNREARSAQTNAAYKNPDGDSRGAWRADNYKCNKSADERPNLYYPIKQPKTGKDIWPQRTAVWRYSRDKHEQHEREGRVWWGLDGLNEVPAYKRFLSDVEGVVAQTIWLWSEVGHNDEAKKEIQNLFPDTPNVFPTPKPTRLLTKILNLATSGDEPEIVLDFFSGSGTTGDAVMRLQAAAGGERRFIAVQFPEPTGRPDYSTIADITKERLRRAGRRLLEEGLTAEGADCGFRVFKLASSNIREWDPEPDTLPATLERAVEHLRQDRSEQDILYELVLKLGLAARGESGA